MTNNSLEKAVDQIITLKAFSRAIAREAHVLTHQPDILWQQLYNRLQWEVDEVKQTIAPELAQRSDQGARPWLRLKTPHRESEALMRTIENPHSGPRPSWVHACAFSPDGMWIASAGWDHMIRVWAVSSGQLSLTLKGHTNRVTACAFSSDGNFIVSSSYDSSLRVWDATSGLLLNSFEGPKYVETCAISPDCKFVVFNGPRSSLQLLNLSTGEQLCTMEGHTMEVKACDFSPDGHLIISASADNTVRVWNASTGKLLKTLLGHFNEVNACAFSPDGRLIVSASADKTVRVWKFSSDRPLHTFKKHTSYVNSCAFSPDGRLIISASDDKTLIVWDTNTGRELQTLVGHIGEIRGCAFSPDGHLIVSASNDSTMRLWDNSKIQLPQNLEGHSKRVKNIGFSLDGRHIVSGSDDKTVRMWNTSSGKSMGKLVGHAKRVNACAFSPDGHLIVSGSDDKTARVWDADSCKLMYTLVGHLSKVETVEFLLDGHLILSGSSRMRLWDVSNGKELHMLMINYREYVLSPNRSLIVGREVGVKNPRLLVWEVSTGKVLRDLESEYGMKLKSKSIKFSPDGRNLLLEEGKEYHLIDFDSGRVIHTLEHLSLAGTHHRLFSSKFSPDGRWIASGFKGSLLVWDATNGKRLYILDIPIIEVVFSPDGRFIISRSADKTVRVWDLKTGMMKARIPLPGELSSFALDPLTPQVVCGDLSGAIYRLEIKGISYGPIIVTATELREKIEVRCPACQQKHLVSKIQLDKEMTCPTPNCGLSLRLNKFIIKRSYVI